MKRTFSQEEEGDSEPPAKTTRTVLNLVDEHSSFAAAPIPSPSPSPSPSLGPGLFASSGDAFQSVNNFNNNASLSLSSQPSEGVVCPICLDKWTVNGAHRIVALKCGHLFGRLCIEKWLRQSKTCVTCKEPAKLNDIRCLFVAAISALDTTEKERLEKALSAERSQRAKLEAAHQELTLSYKAAMSRIALLERNSPPLSLPRQVPTSSSSAAQIARAPLATSPPQALTRLQDGFPLVFDRISAVEDARVIEVNEFTGTLFIAEKAGVRMLSPLDLANASWLRVHTEAVRDLKCSPHHPNHLLSASADRSLKLTDSSSLNCVASYTVDQQLWSCSWSLADSNIVYAGGNLGQLYCFDLRQTKSPLPLPPNLDRKPIHSLCAARTNPSSTELSRALLISGSIDGVRAWDPVTMVTSELLSGHCSSLAFDKNSNFLLSSFKKTHASARSFHGIHSLHSRQGQIGVRADELRSIYCSGTNARVTRSRLFSTPTQGLYLSFSDSASWAVEVWNANSGQRLASLSVNPDDIPVDYAAVQRHSDNGFDLFSVSLTSIKSCKLLL